MNKRFLGRVRVVAVVCALVMLVIIGRLYVLQIMHGQTYAARAEAQSTKPTTALLDRGFIYFTDKKGVQITAATMRENASSTAKVRFYPGGSLAAQEIGFVAYNNDNVQKGRYGLERKYDSILERSGDDLYTNFFVELFGGVRSLVQGDAQQGDIITTIEPSVQAELERQLALYNQTWHPKLAGGIIMDPQTGEIYAMAVSPNFDLNSFNTQTDPLIYANPMVQNVYEMGSIIKPLTMAAGIDSGAVSEKTTYNDTGCITVDTKKICNFDLKARGTIPMQQVLSQSLNLGASFVATRMGPAVMRDYFLNHYALGQKTGIDLPSEQSGLTSNLHAAQQVGYDTASFGQGIAMTPIETARALSVLANGGYLVVPHLVQAVRYTSGITKQLDWGKKEQVLKPETAVVVSRMLTAVVDTSLAEGRDKIEHYSVAAKTGTAQIANPAGGGYYTDRFLHSFFGYFPSYDAKFVIFLFAVEPSGAQYASQTLAPPWHSLTQFLINYYDVPPDR